MDPAEEATPSLSSVDPQQRQLLHLVQNIRQNAELCDVTFSVGKGEEHTRRTFEANGTVLALRSDYFKAMCFGPLKSNEVKVIPDVDPPIFEKVCKEDRNNVT